MKILILSIYYNRPKLLKKAMESILNAHKYHQDWELIFGDDNSPIPGEPIVRDILGDFQDRITYINSNMTFEEKLQNGLIIGKYANEVLLQTNGEIAITLCDDDQLIPTYMRDISNYFEHNKDVMYAYSHLSVINPLFDNSEPLQDNIYNFTKDPINPTGKLDSSQVAFRTKTFREGVRYPESTKVENMPWLVNPDAYLFQQLFDKYGPCPFTGLTAQYKGIHDYQLVWHKKNGEKGLTEYINNINQLAGDKF